MLGTAFSEDRELASSQGILFHWKSVLIGSFFFFQKENGVGESSPGPLPTEQPPEDLVMLREHRRHPPPLQLHLEATQCLHDPDVLSLRGGPLLLC